MLHYFSLFLFKPVEKCCTTFTIAFNGNQFDVKNNKADHLSCMQSRLRLTDEQFFSFFFLFFFLPSTSREKEFEPKRDATDQQTDQPTGRVRYRVACTRLKNKNE